MLKDSIRDFLKQFWVDPLVLQQVQLVELEF
jgi:hypothetical protein